MAVINRVEEVEVADEKQKNSLGHQKRAKTKLKTNFPDLTLIVQATYLNILYLLLLLLLLLPAMFLYIKGLWEGGRNSLF